MMKKRQEKEINPQYNQFSQQGRFGSELDWDLESEFESASQDLEQSDSVVSALPNPEWNRDDLAPFRPPWSSQTVDAVDSVTYGTLDVASATSAYSGQAQVIDYDDILDIESDSTLGAGKTVSSSSLDDLYQEPHANVRVDRVRRMLNEALERWWSYSELPDLGILRDGLLALEAGHDLDESQRSILMRAALYHRRGTHTALSHQTDPDRTAFLLQEALLDPEAPFPLDLLHELRIQDAQSEQWTQLLSQSLREDLGEIVDEKHHWIRRILTRLEQPIEKRPPPEPELRQMATEPVATKSTPRQPTMPKLWGLRPAHWSAPRLITTLTILLLLMGVYLWQSQQVTASKWAVIPEGAYTISDPNNADQERIVTLDAFVIEQTEVTNWQYRRCYEAEVCPQPTYDRNATRPSYLMNRDFDSYPVVYVTWNEANTYCQWIDRHLPSAAEWEVAASIAPATQRRYLYPWGDRFKTELANTGANQIDAAQPVGLYHPAGDSPFGVWDMAGNVAEWTETAPAVQLDHALVKGGSYSDEPDAVQASAYQILPRTGAAPWLGFRCAKRLAQVGR